jgi:single-strand DNA-binding protein
MNTINLIGRLTQDPERRGDGDHGAVVVLRLAVPRRRGTDHAGAVFINVVCFGRQAEVAEEYLYKGRRVAVEGRLDHWEWTGPDGEARARHEVVAERVQFLDARPRAQADETVEA